MADLPALFNELIRFETELWNAVDRRIRAEHHLPLTWLEPMQVIERRRGCRVQDIAHDLSITVGGSSKLVDRIEAAAYCRRLPNPSDRRSSIIELTPGGKQLLTKATATFLDELEQRLGSAIPVLALDEFAAAIDALRGRAKYSTALRPRSITFPDSGE